MKLLENTEITNAYSRRIGDTEIACIVGETKDNQPISNRERKEQGKDIAEIKVRLDKVEKEMNEKEKADS